MFNRKPIEKTGLEKAIDSVLNDLDGWTSDEEEHQKAVDQLETLYQLKALDKPERVSRDALLTVAGNLLITGIVVGYEQSNVITTKAATFWSKFR